MFIIKGEVSRKDLIREIEKAIKSDELGAFIGAGLSIPAGFCSWKELLREPAEEIGLDVEKESDLVNLAQYYSNSKKRTSIDDLIKGQFSQLVKPTENHKLLSQLPISTFWTTNYDKLIEKALENNMKKPYVKTKDEQLRGTNHNFDAIVYKLHGDVETPEDAVITRSDYEEFGYNKRKLFREVLEGDLLTKTFLFLGFSFEDPNFNYVIGRLRVLLDEKNTRKHYCIMKRVQDADEDYEYKKARQELQIEDLNRYGIFTYLVNKYDEITEILSTLVDRFRRKTIFISGSAYSYSAYSQKTGENFIHKLSFELSKNGYHIVNGYGKGVGEFVLNGVADYCLTHKSKINDFLTLMPFPQNSSLGIDLDKLYKENREQMIESCGIAIFLFGNKEAEDIASGVMDEYELSKKHGLVCLPIEYTGGASKEIYDQTTQEISDKIQ
ncbi:SIR2 family protein [Streptococcus equi subsp. equi]|uniref:SIR2 family protein n=1 Tax=Streptococcus equi TaxID=1336 RepID=UPI00294B8969|nr:SIR2 family protein [Streptococcus equi]WOK46360.1 SIR2 family protein [Streptococcus equi subsp. equi]WOK48219.1 SIR2 family protein [Streptococcus equi subsp. equi]WOK50122.1 SIR2 family protein [Streptococcus equi subsp. equi]